jgi:6-pyruvoyltetrahydropterin/6-carboxytetrahydropterin synthase
MFELKVKNNFSAAHKLAMVGEKCENLHGHNWHIEARVTGEKLNSAGVVVDFGHIKQFVNKIMKELDHKYLNEIEIFNDKQPTSERIAIYIAEKLQAYLSKLDEKVNVSSVTAWESEDASATYFL